MYSVKLINKTNPIIWFWICSVQLIVKMRINILFTNNQKVNSFLAVLIAMQKLRNPATIVLDLVVHIKYVHTATLSTM